MRLDKYLAHANVGSRKEVKKLIRKAFVKVDDQVIRDDDYQINDQNIIKVYDKVVTLQANVYIMMNKAKGYVCANDDKLNPTIFDLLDIYQKDLVCVGRLDKDTTGLLLISNDGDFVHNIIKPKKNIKKYYEVLIDDYISQNDIDLFNKGVIIDKDIQLKPASLSIIEEYDNDTSLVLVVISEGKFHQVKKMMKAINKNVLALKRIKVGKLELDKSLDYGEYRFLTDEEVKNIF